MTNVYIYLLMQDQSEDDKIIGWNLTEEWATY